MAVFNPKKGEAETRTSAVPPLENQSSLIGKTLLIKGEVLSEEDVMIDGMIEGKIIVKNRVTIGKNAHIRADIEARHVVIRGRVSGDVHAVGQVEIVSEGTLHGNIISPKVVIADGAVFEGNIDMKSRNENGENPPDGDSSSEPEPSAGQAEQGNHPHFSKKH